MNGRVLVQAPRRKMHLAAVYGPDVYASFCDRLVVAREGVDVLPFSEAGGATKRLVEELANLTAGRDVCAYCARMIGLVAILEGDRWHASA